MSLLEKELGISKEETQIIKEPEHDLVNRPPDDLMVVEDKVDSEAVQAELRSQRGKDSLGQESNVLENKKDNLNNKDSP